MILIFPSVQFFGRMISGRMNQTFSFGITRSTLLDATLHQLNNLGKIKSSCCRYYKVHKLELLIATLKAYIAT